MSGGSFEPESGAFSVQVLDSQTQENITQFSDYNAGYSYNVGSMEDATYGVSDDSTLSLSEFFARPIIIDQFAWDNTTLDNTFNPWELYLENPRVSNRMSNYKNLRARLNIKLMVNGNPFYYGLAILAYQPLHATDTMFDYSIGDFGNTMQLSQMPHIWIDPSNNIGGQMVLPFVWPYNAIDLTKNNDFQSLGLCYFQPVVTLKHASGTVNPVTITVMAWLSDVTLSGPTSHNMAGMIPQGGDEYSSGATQAAPMTKISSMMMALKPYVRATEIIMDKSIAVAQLLGFSRPVNVVDVPPMTQKNYGNLVNVNLGDAIQKLTLDVKQETTIDPRTAGLTPEDEMELVGLAKRESLLTVFGWDTTDGVGTPLHYHKITPLQFHAGSETINKITMTPACWVAAPFQYWRGSMMLRFKIVASNFHKGRLRISYDPTYSSFYDDMNVVRNHIVDIAECKDFCITVGWSQPRSYAKVGTFTSIPYGNVPIVADNIFDNGTLKVEVLNELTSSNPLVDNNITIVVMTSMCDDFEVQSPSPAIVSASTIFNPNVPPGLLAFEPEGGMSAVDEHADMDNAPCMEDTVCELGSMLAADHTPEIYFGEHIASWRACLKRYAWHHAMYVTPVNNNVTYAFDRPNFPIYRGYSPEGVNLTATSVPYNFTEMTLLNWVAPAYIGYRGGLRHKYSYSVRAGAQAGFMELSAIREPTGWRDTAYPKAAVGSVDNTASNSYWSRKNLTNTWYGSTFTNVGLNNVVEGEIPYYANKRFESTRIKVVEDVTSPTLPVHRLDVEVQNAGAVQNYVSVGEDFTLFFFLCTPQIWIDNNDPLPLDP